MLVIERLTPAGKGGVAVTLLKGDGAESVFRQYYQGHLDDERPNYGRLQLLNGQYEAAVVHRISGNEIEIHSHGGELLVSAVELLFVQAGAVRQETSPQVSVQIKDGQTLQEAAWHVLPYAPTERVARILLEYFNASKDGGDSGSPLSLQFLQDLIKPFRVVLAGAANAGKSTLLNAVLGFQRSIVDATPGTTRDVVSGQTSINGFPFIFYDTAGLRTELQASNTPGSIETEGIERAKRAVAEADLTLWVMDSVNPVFPPENGGSLLLCFNKTDLCRFAVPDGAAAVSAAAGEGIAELLESVFKRMSAVRGIGDR
ncbi:MAG: 50S ribosome-binding GTPase [Planctomycetaceae bacterium]|jgi:tRNA modification GTPase|nr:50S ribosome-binding GTPase [Planctomycetaceae bacterium]